jgi:hypothetical protein
MRLLQIYISSGGVGIIAGVIIGLFIDTSLGDMGPLSAVIFGAIFFAPILFTMGLLTKDERFRHGFGLYDLLEGACWLVWSPLAVGFGVFLTS